MGSCEVKPGKSQKGSAQKNINAGFVVAGLLMLLIYLVAQHFAVSAPHVVITEAQEIMDNIKAPGETVVITEAQQIMDNVKAPSETVENGKVECKMEGRSDSCEVDGDVRTNGTALSVTLVPATASSSSERREWMIRPYSRRFASLKKVTVTQLQDPAAAPRCTVTHNTPAVLFAVGGYAGNYWHDYADILVPLFVASRRFRGEVTFLISNIQFQPRWLVKYKAFLQGLSKYDYVDMDADGEQVIRCFRHVTVGLRLDKEFSIVPELVPGDRRLAMPDFTAFLRETYSLPRGTASGKEKKPRLMLIHRGHYRRILNEPEVARAAEAAGFEVEVKELRGETTEAEQARLVNSFDAVVGLHGAGLTNAVFLPAGGVVIQVVPYGKMEHIARAEFGEPVADMGLKYLEYSVGAEESSLMETLGPDHPAVKDPDSVHRSGWSQVFELYLAKQNVRINVTRFAPTLQQAISHLRSASSS
ncbi:unnamed protein product [Urochloa humidicola]